MTILDRLQRLPSLADWEFRPGLNLATDVRHLHSSPAPDRLPIFTGKQLDAFDLRRDAASYYIEDTEVRPSMNSDRYRLVFRDVTRKSDRRSMIAAILPPRHVCAHNVAVELRPSQHSNQARLCVLALFNSFVLDFALRERISALHVLPALRRLPIPDLQRIKTTQTDSIITRSASLVCTSHEYAALARSLQRRVTPLSDSARSRLHAELDALIARALQITEEEFVDVLAGFPLVPEPVRVAAHNAYRDAEKGLLQ